MNEITARTQGHAQNLRVATVATTLGHLLVAADDSAVVFTTFADSADGARSVLATRFPSASIEEADATARTWAAAIAAVAESGDPSHAEGIPVRLAGTEFQRAVWEQLRVIPKGETISYGELAHRIGNPRAVRAVARACGANPVGVLVPCHRVIGADGSLTGFASGVERKRSLLEREGAL